MFLMVIGLFKSSFSFPRRFYFFDINSLQSVWGESGAESFEIEFHFDRPMPGNIKIRDEDLKLYCSPAINLFHHNADPIDSDGKRTEYKIRPSSSEPGALRGFFL